MLYEAKLGNLRILCKRKILIPKGKCRIFRVFSRFFHDFLCFSAIFYDFQEKFQISITFSKNIAASSLTTLWKALMLRNRVYRDKEK